MIPHDQPDMYSPKGAAINALLGAYVSGQVNAPLKALVDAHLEISPRNREYVRSLEALYGTMIDSAPPMAPADRSRMLDGIFAGEGHVAPARMPRGPRQTRLPAVLSDYIGADIDDVAWKFVLPGIREYKIQDDDHGEASLIWMKAGHAAPVHTHEGSEITLVLEGAFHDVNGIYRRGDIAIADDDVDHKPVASTDGDCICFAVLDAPLRLTGPIGRLVDRLTRRG